MNGATSIRLENPHLSADIAMSEGMTITSIVDRASQGELLLILPDHRDVEKGGVRDSVDFARGYRGGWHVAVPNAGYECVVDGVYWPHFGEAVWREWSVEHRTDSSLTASVSLESTRLTVRRNAALHERRIEVTDRITNRGEATSKLSVLHHPAFGERLAAGRCRIHVGARRLVGTTRPTPWLEEAGRRFDGRLPAPEDPWPLMDEAGPAQTRFAYLADFETGWFRLVNDDTGAGVELSWDSRMMPYAWIWQESPANQAGPWNGRSTVAAVEPCTTIPNGRVAEVARSGGPLLRIEAGATTTISVRLEVPRKQDIDGGPPCN